MYRKRFFCHTDQLIEQYIQMQEIQVRLEAVLCK